MVMPRVLTAAALGLLLAGCEGIDPIKDVDEGIDAKRLGQIRAGIWTDPDGCDHWIIDDGVEGYLTERVHPDGRPVCRGTAPRGTAVGGFKTGSIIPDVI